MGLNHEVLCYIHGGGQLVKGIDGFEEYKGVTLMPYV